MDETDNPKTLKEQLLADLAIVDWRILEPHIKKDHLIIVDSDLDLVTTALNIVEDNTELITPLIEANKLRKPAAEEIELWSQFPDKEMFKVLIAQPYVLVQIKLLRDDLN